MKRLLLVEDDAELRDLYARYLDDAGYCVAVARDGVEAVEVAEMVHPHAIVMDIDLPRMNGCEAARLIRCDAATRDVRLIALTGATEEELAGLPVEEFARVVSKPCAANTLADILAEAG
ncbi:MAG: Response regulator [bacterium]|nr:Response regulator [bacterium]